MNIEKFEITTAEDNAFITNVFDTKTVSADNSRIRHTTTTDEKRLFNALSGKSEPVKKYIGQVVEVVDIVITAADVAVDINNRDGEKVNKPVAHFFTADGKHLATLSNGIIRNLKDLLSCGMIPTTESPLAIRFEEVETAKGTAHTFDLV